MTILGITFLIYIILYCLIFIIHITINACVLMKMGI